MVIVMVTSGPGVGWVYRVYWMSTGVFDTHRTSLRKVYLLKCGSVQFYSLQCGAVEFKQVQFGTIQFNLLQCGRVKFCPNL